jgi:hypothetical protein
VGLLRLTSTWLMFHVATSAVDLDTDRSIQDIIKHIPGITLLTIAHRINTYVQLCYNALGARILITFSASWTMTASSCSMPERCFFCHLVDYAHTHHILRSSSTTRLPRCLKTNHLCSLLSQSLADWRKPSDPLARTIKVPFKS